MISGRWQPVPSRKLKNRCLMDVMNLNQQSMVQYIHTISFCRKVAASSHRSDRCWWWNLRRRQQFPAMMTSITAEGLQVSIGGVCSCEKNNKLILRFVHFVVLFFGNPCLLVCAEMFLAEIYRDEKIWTQHPSQCRFNKNIDCTKSQVVYLSVPSGHV